MADLHRHRKLFGQSKSNYGYFVPQPQFVVFSKEVKQDVAVVLSFTYKIVTVKCDSVCACVFALTKLLDVKTRSLPRLTLTLRFHKKSSVVMMM